MRQSSVQRQDTVHFSENVLNGMQELSDIGLKKSADGTDPESINLGQLSRIDNHTTVTEPSVKLGELECWILRRVERRDDEALQTSESR